MTTPDTPAHTPLPWQVIGSDPSEGFDCFWIKGQPSPLLRGFTQEIGCINGSQLSAEPSANAAFIVRACNSHYLLIEALRVIIDHFDCSHGNAPGHDHLIPGVWDKDVSNGAKGGTKCGWCEQWNEARAALSQAGGASE